MDKSSDFSGTQSPSKNPFNVNESCEGDSSFRIASFKDAGRPSLAALTEGDFLPRESLGLLPDSTLFRDSLTRESLIFNINLNTEGGNSKGLHNETFTRESLGILNLSALDLDRESMGFFNLDLNAIRRQSSAVFKDPNTCLPIPQKPENKIPNIVLSSVDDHSDSSNFSGLNKAFLLSTSRNFPSTSSCSPILSDNISFNTRSLAEVSRICSLSPRSIDTGSIGFKLDPLNEAFQVMPEINVVSLSDKIGSSEFDADIENLRNRIKSWPLRVDKNAILEDLVMGHKASHELNASFDEGFICRGVEQEKNMVDSVFLETINESLAFEDKSFNEERYLLDCTPQPEWADWDTSKSAELKETGEDIIKKVDKLFGALPISPEDILNTKANNKSDNSSCDNNVSQNVSRISRGSQCSLLHFQSGCNLSQDLSKISKCSHNSSADVLLKSLGDIIAENHKLSGSKKKEAQHFLGRLANLLNESGNDDYQNAEDSGHSSVDEQLENKENQDPEVYEILDLSCKSNGTNRVNASFSRSNSPSVKNPPPYSVYSPNRALILNKSTRSNNSNASSQNNSNTSKLINISGISQNNSNNSAKNESVPKVSSLRRQSSLSQNKVNFSSNQLKKTNSAGVLTSRPQPMRAVLPVEKMTKTTKSSPKSVTATPEKITINRFTLPSKKTSTPIQAAKLKPVAASTPAPHENLEASGRPKLTRSFSYQGRPSPNAPTVKRSVSKAETLKPVRRNSVTENALGANKGSEGLGDSPKRRRCNSGTGKEPRILSALSRVRQNILNSPYYARKSTGGEQKSSDLSTGAEKSASVSKNKV